MNERVASTAAPSRFDLRAAAVFYSRALRDGLRGTPPAAGEADCRAKVAGVVRQLRQARLALAPDPLIDTLAAEAVSVSNGDVVFDLDTVSLKLARRWVLT